MGTVSVSSAIPVVDVSVEDRRTADALTSAISTHGFVFVNGETGFSEIFLDKIFRVVGTCYVDVE